MQDIPGVSCGCGEKKHSVRASKENKIDNKRNNRCDSCDTPLEWRLRLNGVTELECPKCTS